MIILFWILVGVLVACAVVVGWILWTIRDPVDEIYNEYVQKHNRQN